MRGITRRAGALFVLALICVEANAAFILPSQWTRGDANSTYQEWDLFNTIAGPNAPDVGKINPNGNANVADASIGGFVPGSGNIYNPGAALLVDVDVPHYALGDTHGTQVLVQVRTQGSELNYNTVRLTYNDGVPKTISPAPRTELERIVLGGPFGGARVDSLWLFDLPFAPSTFRIELDGAESSVSLDRVSVDTFASPIPVPEPALGVTLPALGLLALRRRHRRK